MRGARVSPVLVAVWLSATLAGPAPAVPLPAGGQVVGTATTAASFVVRGRGYGHGVGMSQYGARGAAALGRTRGQILSTYYPNTTRSTSLPAGLDNIRVSLMPSSPTGGRPPFVDVEAVSDKVAWRLDGVTKRQPAGRTWRASVSADGRYTVRWGETTIFAAARGPLRITLGGKIVRLPAKDRRYNRGSLVLSWAGVGSATFVTATINSLDRYLYGLAEMPSSWPRPALEAQAIAGRTYALQRRESRDTTNGKWTTCRCDVYDSVSDQVYSAYEWESQAPRWIGAVDATSGRTLRHAGATITAFYHSSSGGHVESSEFVFGTKLGYSTAFDDSTWESASGNPNAAWQQTFTAAAIGNAFGVGTATAVATPAPRGPSGRIGDPKRGAGGVVISGVRDGRTVTTTVSGADFRSKLGLKSTLFRVVTG